ncbi:MAG: hypothetical protein NUV49_00715 [Patescibacteria group bacterium]|nr:hypothetical protein [Patescibacteria group bacterium]
MKNTKDANKLAIWFGLLSIISIATSAWFFSERLYNSGIVLFLIALVFAFIALRYMMYAMFKR